VHDVGQNQRITQKENHIVKPSFLKCPSAHPRQEDEHKNAEKQLAALKEHILALNLS
jgi:hypothetical protein